MNGLVLLASYPKSGNTWIRALLSSIGTGGQSVDINRLGILNCADRTFCDQILGIRSSNLTNVEFARLRPTIYEFALRATDQDLFFKVHDAFLPTFPDTSVPFPADRIKRVIYIVRDPRDVVVSLANHVGRPVPHVIRQIARPSYMFANNPRGLRLQLPQLLSTWSRHVESWTAHKSFPVLIMKYEKMLESPFQQFRAMLDFLERDTPDDVLAAAIEATRFDKLKAQEQTFGFGEKPPKSGGFFRKGVANGWKDTLAIDEVEKIESDHRLVMSQLGYLTVESPPAANAYQTVAGALGSPPNG